MTHTKTPWKYEEETETIRSTPSNYWIASMDSWDGAVNNEANARFIVKAVNNHEQLVEMLKSCLNILKDQEILKEYQNNNQAKIIALSIIEKAISKAESEA